jgi:uroporphyrin-III C-methyltransferase
MGRVIFIGAGPGAADLITVRGAQRLSSSDVVLFDALSDPALRIYAPKARWIDVGKRGFAAARQPGAPAYDSTKQDAINALIVEHALESNVVVRLKGGDPSIFGRLEEELEALRAAGIACEVVPGVSAALAAAADTQRPLTRRGSGRSVAFATAMSREGAVVPARSADTEVFYMGGKQLAALGRRLRAAGWPTATPVSVVSRAGWPDQLHTDHTIESLAQATVVHAGRPTVITVGAGAATLDAGPAATSTAAAPLADARHGAAHVSKP